jgi:hypothetical protein
LPEIPRLTPRGPSDCVTAVKVRGRLWSPLLLAVGESKALELIHEVLSSKFDLDVFGNPIDRRRLQTPEEHGQCHLCR